MAMIDPSEWNLGNLLPVNSRRWTCCNPTCSIVWSGEIDGPECCPLCGAQGWPGVLGMALRFPDDEGRWWECPTGCRIWFGPLQEPQRCPRCHGLAKPSQFEGYTPDAP